MLAVASHLAKLRRTVSAVVNACYPRRENPTAATNVTEDLGRLY